MTRLARLERALQSLASVGYLPYLVPIFMGWAWGAGVSSFAPGLGQAIDRKFGGLVLVAVAVVVSLAAIYLVSRFRRGASAPRALADASLWLGSRFAFVGAMPLLAALSERLEAKHPFRVVFYALIAAAAVGVTVYSVWRDTSGATSPKKEARRDWAAWAGVALLGSVHAAVFASLAIANHLSFNTRRADLGFYVSIFRRSSLGDPLGCSLCGGGNHLSGHFDPLLVPLSASFWLLPKAETLLVLQSIWLASSVAPLFLLARHYGLGRIASLGICVCFCAYPALHGVNLYDFHSLALIVPLALWWFWTWETERERGYWFFFVLMLLCREDVALLSMVFGAGVAMSGGKNGARIGFTTIAIAAAYFLAIKIFLMEGADPLRPGKGAGYAYYYASLVPKGQGTAGLVNSVFTNPEALLSTMTTEKKVVYLLQLFAPVLFLPVFAVRGRFTLLYGLAFCLLVTREFVPTVHFHYSALLVPFVFALTASALGRARRVSWAGLRGEALVPALVAAALVSSGVLSWKFGAVVPNATFRAGFRPLDRKPKPSQIAVSAMLDDYCRGVENGQVVAASSGILTHLARCPAIVLREKRYEADFLVWKRGSGGDRAAIEREIARGSLVQKRKLGHGYAVYEARYSDADKRRLRRALKGPTKKSSKKAPRSGS